MRRVLLTLLLVCAALAAMPGAALASAGQVMTFEAPRELLDDATRDRTLAELDGLGVDHVRQLVYWHDFAPNADSRVRPNFDASDPAAYPEGTWARLDRLFAAAQGSGISIQLTLTGPVPRWATKGRRDTVTEPSATEFGAFATAVGRRYGDRVSVWSIWNEPNHPGFLRPQYRRGRPASPAIYRRLFQAGARGLRGSGNQNDTILMGETAPIGNEHLVSPIAFLRGALCLDSTGTRTRVAAPLDADGYAHHPYTKRSGPRYRPPDMTTSRSASSHASCGPSTARRGGRAASRPGHLPDRVRRPEPRPTRLSASHSPPGRVPLDRRADRVLQPAREVVLAVPARDDPPRPARVSRATRDSRPACATSTAAPSRPTRPSGCRSRQRLWALDVIWGRVRPYPHQTTVLLQIAPPGKSGATTRRCRPTRPASTGSRSRMSAGAATGCAGRHQMDKSSPVHRSAPISAA